MQEYVTVGEFGELRKEVKEGFERVDKRFERVDKRFEQVDERFVKIEGKLDQMNDTMNQLQRQTNDNYKLVQRANVLVENLESKIQQIAEGVLETRQIVKKPNNHEERISNLEWRSDMHEKFMKEMHR